MSMNLNARVDGRDVELWQTPTQITNMICVNSEGMIGTLTGKEAKRALHSYRAWVSGSMNGAWETEEYNRRRAVVDEHIEYINNILKGRKFEVWEI